MLLTQCAIVQGVFINNFILANHYYHNLICIFSTDAGNAFCEAAQLHLRQSNKHDAGTMFVDASNCFKKVDPSRAIRCLEKTIELYQDMGRFTTAAKHHISIAEIYESELVDFEKTVLHYQTAADYYTGEESKASANRCLLKVAQYSALNSDFLKVIVVVTCVFSSKI